MSVLIAVLLFLILFLNLQSYGTREHDDVHPLKIIIQNDV